MSSDMKSRCRGGEAKLREALTGFVEPLERQGHRLRAVAEFRPEAVWFVLWLLGRPLARGDRVPERLEED